MSSVKSSVSSVTSAASSALKSAASAASSSLSSSSSSAAQAIPTPPSFDPNAPVVVSVFNLTTIGSLLAVAALIAGTYQATLMILPATASRKSKLLFAWHVFDAGMHFTIEAAYLFCCFFITTPVLPTGPDPAAAGGFFGLFKATPHPAVVAAREAAAAALRGAIPPPPLTPPNTHFLADSSRHYGPAFGGGPLGSVWREYGRADARWAGADPVIISIELATVFLAAPLGAYCAFLIYKAETSLLEVSASARVTEIMNHLISFKSSASSSKTEKDETNPDDTTKADADAAAAAAAETAKTQSTGTWGVRDRWFWMSVLAAAELYGGWMTFAPEWLMGSPHLLLGGHTHLPSSVVTPGIVDPLADPSAVPPPTDPLALNLAPRPAGALEMWLYLVIFNGAWVVIPAWVLVQAWKRGRNALDREEVLAVVQFLEKSA